MNIALYGALFITIINNVFIGEQCYKIVKEEISMGKNPLKRSLIVGIIMLFVSTACLPVLANEEKPDLVIENIFRWPNDTPFEYEFKCTIKNIGDDPIWQGDYWINVRVYWMLFGHIPLIRIKSHTVKAHIGGLIFGNKTCNLTVQSCETLPKFGTYRIFLEINPTLIIDESNYDNNKYSEDWKVFLWDWKEI